MAQRAFTNPTIIYFVISTALEAITRLCVLVFLLANEVFGFVDEVGHFLVGLVYNCRESEELVSSVRELAAHLYVHDATALRSYNVMACGHSLRSCQVCQVFNFLSWSSLLQIWASAKACVNGWIHIACLYWMTGRPGLVPFLLLLQ